MARVAAVTRVLTLTWELLHVAGIDQKNSYNLKSWLCSISQKVADLMGLFASNCIVSQDLGFAIQGAKVLATHSLYLPGSGRSQWGCLSGQEEVVMPREAGLSLEACLFKPLLPLSSLTPAWGPWKGQWRQRKAKTFGDEITMEVIPSWEQLERI